MAIIRKSELRRHLDELKARYDRLWSAVNGNTPNPNIYEQYAHDPEQYKKDFTEINITDVEYALSDFQTVLKRLETIQKLQADKLKPNK